MANETTTAADDQSQTTDPNATASQTTTDTTGSDNLDTSKTTDTTSTGDDKTTTTTEGDAGTPAKKFDTDLDEWAGKTNRAVPSTDRERELYQEIRDSQRDFSRSRQAKDSTAAVQTAVDSAKPDNKVDPENDERDPLEVRQDAMEAQFREERTLRHRSEYFTEKSVTADEGKTMGEILKEKVDRAATPAAKQAAYDYWTDPNNLEDWHDLAKARLAVSPDISVVEQEAARKERERIAKESQAAGGNRNATTTSTEKKSGYDRATYLKSDD